MLLKTMAVMASAVIFAVAAAGEEAVQFLPDRPGGKVARRNTIWGAAGHFIHQTKFDRTFSPYWAPEYTLPWMVRAGMEWVREPLYLNLFVDQNGRLHPEYTAKIDEYLSIYDRAGLRVILCPMFDLPDKRFDVFIDWVAQLARRHPSIEVIELHNEPNLKTFWKHTPQDYVNCCKRAYGRIKRIAPDITVCTGAFSNFGKCGEHPELVKKYEAEAPDRTEALRRIATGYFRECLEAGLLECSDAVSFHPYNETSEGAGSYWMPATDPDGFEKELQDLAALVKSYNKDNKYIKFYFTELGRSVSEIHCPDEAAQADYLSRVMLVYFGARVNGFPLEAVCWYDLKCDDFKQGVPPHESSFGLISNDGARGRPAYWYYAALIDYFGDPREYSPAADCVVKFSDNAAAVKHFAWKHRNGMLVVPYWRMIQIDAVKEDFPTLLTVEGIKRPVREVRLFDPAAREPRSIGFRQAGTRLEIPVWVYSRANWLEIAF